MLLLLAAYLGGVLTILSPCILPVLPFVFARADKSFARSGLPMLAGMIATFALVSTLAAAGGAWAVEANRVGRYAALAVLAVMGVALLSPAFSTWATRPLVRLGERLSQPGAQNQTMLSGFVTGVATGLLWAPCAGPILGLILTGAALNGASLATTGLLAAYGAGAATSLALAILVGGRVFQTMKKSLGVGEHVRRVLGGLVLAGVAAIALGFDTTTLAKLSTANTTRVEQTLLDRLRPVVATPASASADAQAAHGPLGALSAATGWLNGPALTAADLKGKVVLIDFWTYSCINCIRTIPYVRAWDAKYRDKGLVVIGVHTPEFAFEKIESNVRKAIADLGIAYPVAIDNDYGIWRGFANQYWPAHYFIDAQGRIRHTHFGEGAYAESEKVIQDLLAEAGATGLSADMVTVQADGAQKAADFTDVLSPETYVGYARAAGFASPDPLIRDAAQTYDEPHTLARNQWGLTGTWTVGEETARLDAAGGGIVFRFHARDLHLVLGPGADGKPVRFRVRIDGQAPGGAAGVDVAADGSGTVSEDRLYQLVRQSGAIADRTFSIEFLDPGVHAFAFTFG